MRLVHVKCAHQSECLCFLLFDWMFGRVNDKHLTVWVSVGWHWCDFIHLINGMLWLLWLENGQCCRCISFHCEWVDWCQIQLNVVFGVWMWWFVVLWYGSFELVSVWYCWVEWQLWRDTLSHWCNVFFLFLSNRHRVDQHDNRGDRHHLLLHWQVWKETQTKWKTEEANHTDISRWVCFRVVCELWATQFTHTHIFKQLTDVFEYLCQRPSHISPTYPHKHTHKHKHNTPPSHPHIHTRSSQLPATVHKCTQMHTTHTPEPLVSLTHRRTLQPHADVTLQLSLSQPPPTSDNTQITITSICFILFRLQNLERHQTQHRLPVQHRTTTISTSTTLTSLVRGEDDLDLVQHHQTHQPARHQSPVQWNVSHTHNNSYSTVHTSSHIFTLIIAYHARHIQHSIHILLSVQTATMNRTKYLTSIDRPEGLTAHWV